jgi:2-polyprenyl-3-methyl-5-hydroxy-6-metoxy-1,4-benzoquinol methylase
MFKWPKKKIVQGIISHTTKLNYIPPQEGMSEEQLKVALKMQELDILEQSKGTKYEFFEAEAIRMPLDESATGYANPSQLKRVHAILDSVGTGKTVLDVSGGEGWIARLIKAQGNDVTVTDVSQIRNLRAKWIYKVKHVICRAEKLPFPDESFDVVILAEILEHLPKMSVGLAEAERVVKKTGRIIITVPVGNWASDYIHHLHEINFKNIDNAMIVLTIDKIIPHYDTFIKSNLNRLD